MEYKILIRLPNYIQELKRFNKVRKALSSIRSSGVVPLFRVPLFNGCENKQTREYLSLLTLQAREERELAV